MIRDITIGQYLPGKSFLHKMDPRAKILWTLSFVIVIFLCKNFWSLGLMVLTAIGMLLLSRVPMRMMWKSLKPLVPILLFT